LHIFGKLVFESDKQEFSLRVIKSKKVSSHPGGGLLESVLKVRNVLVKVECVEREELSAICLKVVVKGKGRDKSNENLRRVVYMMKSSVGSFSQCWSVFTFRYLSQCFLKLVWNLV